MEPQIKLSHKCSRCPRTDDQVVTYAELDAMRQNTKPKPPAVVILVDGQSVAEYDHLCEACRGIVTSYLLGAARQSEKVTAKRTKAKKKEPTAPSPATAAASGAAVSPRRS